MNKPICRILIFFPLLFSLSHASARGIRVRIGTYEAVTLAADLPNKDAYLIPKEPGWTENHYLDLATLTVNYGLWQTLPLWIEEEPRLVGYDQQTDLYYDLPAEALKSIISQNNLNEKKLLHISFFKRYGGKIILLLLAALIIYGLIPRKKCKKPVTPQHV
ncbi:hypothetical protein A8C56_21610 [Niabella ginsenosidivorans]|uniref:Uncharacterized protein n=1 Tax=Niabella ginsenosidivorans TaxID=1176587 RepID=A0A1A9I6B0_9BACT|nr:hypothetical protein [Niabella ginsenosidivorans]ANH83227.1 hypothetical protein A8C56_21610 [Niabella ginsenosidivorans]